MEWVFGIGLLLLLLIIGKRLAHRGKKRATDRNHAEGCANGCLLGGLLGILTGEDSSDDS